jgi:hypothetical protein
VTQPGRTRVCGLEAPLKDPRAQMDWPLVPRTGGSRQGVPPTWQALRSGVSRLPVCPEKWTNHWLPACSPHAQDRQAGRHLPVPPLLVKAHFQCQAFGQGAIPGLLDSRPNQSGWCLQPKPWVKLAPSPPVKEVQLQGGAQGAFLSSSALLCVFQIYSIRKKLENTNSPPAPPP